MATELNVTPTTVRIWYAHGLLKGYEYNDKGERLSAFPIWVSNPLTRPCTRHPLHAQTHFAPKWANLAGVCFPGLSHDRFSPDAVVFNRCNPLVMMASEEAWEWAKEYTEDTDTDPLDLRGELLENLDRASAWILQVLIEGERQGDEAKEIWQGLVDRDPDFLWLLWRRLFGPAQLSGNARPALLWRQHGDDSSLDVITPSAWVTHAGSDYRNVSQYLPDPGRRWTLKFSR